MPGVGFDDLIAPIAREHRRRAENALDDLIEATDTTTAWHAWRALERSWDAVSPTDRHNLMAYARRHLPTAPDGPRRLAVVEHLPT